MARVPGLSRGGGGLAQVWRVRYPREYRYCRHVVPVTLAVNECIVEWQRASLAIICSAVS